MDPIFTAAQAKALGYDSVAELTAKLNEAAEVAEKSDGLENIAKALTEAVGEFTKATNAATQKQLLENEEEKFIQACNEHLVDVFKALPAEDPKRLEIAATFAKQYGDNIAELVLEGSALTKALHAPVSSRNTKAEDINAFRKAWDDVQFITAIKGGLTPGGGSDELDLNSIKAKQAAEFLVKSGIDGADSVLKALETINAGHGQEWMFTALSSNMAYDLYLDLQVAALFPRVTMPTKQYDIPIRLGRTRGYIVDETAADTAVDSATPFFANKFTASSMTTGKVSLIARKYGVASFLSDEIEQDMLLPALPLLRSEILYGFADGIEDAVLNGAVSLSALDNAGTDTNKLWNNTADAGDGRRLNTGARDARNLWDGLRRSVVTSGITVVDGGGTITLDLMRTVRKGLLKYGVSIDDLVWVISPNTHIDIMRFPEVLTLDKYGPNATVIQGEIGKIDGIPIVISPRMYTDLNASAVFDNSVKTKTTALLINRRAFLFGDRQLMRVESDRNPLAGQRYVLGSWRGDFKKMFAAAEPLIGQLKNINS